MLKAGEKIAPDAQTPAGELGDVFQERFKQALIHAWAPTAKLKPQNVRCLARRDPSFLVKGCMVQTEVRQLDKVSQVEKVWEFWCLFFEGSRSDAKRGDRVFLGFEFAPPAEVAPPSEVVPPESIEHFVNRVETELDRLCVCFCKNDPTNGAHDQNQGCADIDENKVADYVLEFLNYEMARGRGNEVASLPSSLSKYLHPGLLAHHTEAADVLASTLDWSANIHPQEKLELETFLSNHSLRVTGSNAVQTRRLSVLNNETNFSKRLKVCILADDAMVLREYKFFTKRNSTEGLIVTLDDGLKGQIKQVREVKPPLYLGLPSSKIKPGAAWGFSHQYEYTEGWLSVTRQEASDIMQDLGKSMPNADQLDVVRRQRVSFYGWDLLELQPKSLPQESQVADGVAPPIHILRTRGFAAALDKTAAPIHWVNSLVTRDRGAVIRSEADAVEYTLFFGANVWGPDGPFIVLTSGKDKHLAALNYADCGFSNEYDFLEALDGIKYPYASIRSKEGTTTGQANYEVDAWVLYNKVIFKVKFELEPDGGIQMTDDSPSVDYLVDRPKALMARIVKMLGSKAKSDEADRETTLDPESKVESAPETIIDPDGMIDNKVIVGQLSAEALAVRTFRRCRFRGRLNLQHLASPRLSFEQCIFDNGLDLSGANIDGGLSFIDCKVREGKHYRDADSAKPFSLKGLVARELNIEKLVSDMSLTAQVMRIAGAVYVQNVSLQGDLDAGFLQVGTGFVLDGSSWIGGSIELAGAKLPAELRIRNTVVGKSIVATQIVAGAVRILGANFEQKRNAWTAETCAVGDRIDLTDAVIDHDVTIVDVSVGDSDYRESKSTNATELHGEIASLVLRSATVKGNVNVFLTGTKAKTMGLLSGRLKELDPMKKDFPSRWIRGIDLSDCTVGGDVDLTSIKCPQGDIKLADARIEHNLTLRRNDNDQSREPAAGMSDPRRCEANSLIMSSLECKGITDITGFTLNQGTHGGVWAELATFGKELNVSLRNGYIEGARNSVTDVVATLKTLNHQLKVWVKDYGYWTESALKDVSDVIVKLTSLSEDLDVSLKNYEVAGAWERVRVVIAELRRQELKVLVKDDRGSTLRPVANLIAKLTTLRKQRKVLVKDIGRCIKQLDAIRYTHQAIETASYDWLDLSGSTIGDLKISVNDRNGRVPGTIILKYAHVNRLRAILRQTRANGKDYPHPIDLRFAEVKWWDFDPPSSEEGEKGKDYVLLLQENAKVAKLQRHTFRSIEQNLFNQGQEDAADEVHKEMRSQVLEQSGAWTRILWFPLDWLTYANTSPKRLIAWVAIWFLSSILVFSIPGNIAPSPEGISARRARGDTTLSDGPTADKWGWKPAFWVALRYHVPVAAFTAQHEWQPRNDTTLTLPKLWRTETLSASRSSASTTLIDRFFTVIGLRHGVVDAPSISWATPEDYANVVLAFHWILLPVILILTSRKVFRRVDK